MTDFVRRAAFRCSFLALLVVGFGFAAAAKEIEIGNRRSLEPQLSRGWKVDSGERFDPASLRGRPYVVTMFFSDCSSKCPITLERLREIESEISKRGASIDFVLASFDFRNDSPRRLARFRKREKLGEAWHLLSGESASVDRLAKRLGLSGYTDLGDHFVHAVRLALVGEDGAIRKLVEGDADDVKVLVDAVAPDRR